MHPKDFLLSNQPASPFYCFGVVILSPPVSSRSYYTRCFGLLNFATLSHLILNWDIEEERPALLNAKFCKFHALSIRANVNCLLDSNPRRIRKISRKYRERGVSMFVRLVYSCALLIALVDCVGWICVLRRGYLKQSIFREFKQTISTCSCYSHACSLEFHTQNGFPFVAWQISII